SATPGPYAFLEHEAPPTVNPSLWRQAQLNVPNGLFRVTDGVYQVRGFSVSSLSIVEGKTGIIVIDSLATPGAARAALDLYFANRPRRPVVAVIYTHKHGDPWGGARWGGFPGRAPGGENEDNSPAGVQATTPTERN